MLSWPLVRLSSIPFGPTGTIMIVWVFSPSSKRRMTNGTIRWATASNLMRSSKSLTGNSNMSTTEAASKVFEEIAQLFASAPSDEQILSFRPSAEVAQRASQLLILNRSRRVDEDLRHELEQYEQAELLMRMVKAQIRARQES